MITTSEKDMIPKLLQNLHIWSEHRFGGASGIRASQVGSTLASSLLYIVDQAHDYD